MGNIDVAAQAEGIEKFTYYNKSCKCLVYTDEEPPRGPNSKAVEIALEFAKLAVVQKYLKKYTLCAKLW